MKRLAWSVYRDFRIQLRNGYPWITALAALAGIAALARIPQGNSDRLAPLVSLAFSFLTTVPFLIRQVYGERGEGALILLDLTPLRPHEYLASKAISLALPSVAMNTLMVLVSRGPYFNPIPFWLGLAVSGTLFAFTAFLITAWAGNGAKAAVLTVIAGLTLLWPALPGTEALPRVLLDLQPLAGSLRLLAGSYTGTPPVDWMVGAGMALAWTLMVLAACRPAIQRLRGATRPRRDRS